MDKPVIACIMMLIGVTVVRAQTGNTAEQQWIMAASRVETGTVKLPTQVKEFYKLTHYTPVWTISPVNRQQLLYYFSQSASLGLQESDYRSALLTGFSSGALRLLSFTDSLAADIQLTDAAIQFFTDVAYGSEKPALGYNGLNYQPGCIPVVSLLALSVLHGRFDRLLAEVELQSPEYKSVKQLLQQYSTQLIDSLYNETEKITSPKQNDNGILQRKLYQFKLVDSVSLTLTSAEKKEKIKIAQRFFNMQEDGLLNQTLINALNIPLTKRIQELRRTLNLLRWLRCVKAQQRNTVIVNIPSANLLVYNSDSLVFWSKVIVGKPSTRTPTLTSSITEVILYPYWVVPKKIATKEFLPLIKKNIGYLDANNLQVMNSNGRVVDPATINWSQLSATNFPYTLRQSTGCDNSLGIIKLNFYSPFGVYLHDTPWKSLFNFNRRYFSHGCIRVQDAIGLGRLALYDNTVAIDTLTEKGCLYNQKPLPVPVSQHLDVLVLYTTAWFDDKGILRFYPDVYNKFSSR